jgi:hypothetical protein
MKTKNNIVFTALVGLIIMLLGITMHSTGLIVIDDLQMTNESIIHTMVGVTLAMMLYEQKKILMSLLTIVMTLASKIVYMTATDPLADPEIANQLHGLSLTLTAVMIAAIIMDVFIAKFPVEISTK